MLESNVVMTTSSLHFCSPYKLGGGGCMRSRNNTRKKLKWRADVQEKDAVMNENVDVNVDKTPNRNDKVKGLWESSRSLSFRERTTWLSQHRRLLKDELGIQRLYTLICFGWVHLHQEGMTKRSQKHVGGWKYGSIVDRYSRHAWHNPVL